MTWLNTSTPKSVPTFVVCPYVLDWLTDMNSNYLLLSYFCQHYSKEALLVEQHGRNDCCNTSIDISCLDVNLLKLWLLLTTQ